MTRQFRPFAILALALAASVSTGDAFAAPPKQPCYTQAEVRAEQAIRLHTELMVVGLTCGDTGAAAGSGLFAQYKAFTLRHKDEISAWEKTLIGHFRRHAKGDATRSFDTFRTRLANEMSQRAIALSTPVFCGVHAPIAAKAATLSRDELKRLVDADNAVRLTAAPRCEAPAARVAEGTANAVASRAVTAAPTR